jgi:hypothetical protein
LQWDRLIHRLLFECKTEFASSSKTPPNLTSAKYAHISHKILCSERDAEEFAIAQIKIRKKLGTKLNPNGRIVGIARVFRNKCSPNQSGGDFATFLSTSPIISSNMADVSNFPAQLDMLIGRMTKGTSSGANASTSGSSLSRAQSAGKTLSQTRSNSSIFDSPNGSQFHQLLSCSIIEWMHPISYFPKLCDEIALSHGNGWNQPLDRGLTNSEYTKRISAHRSNFLNCKSLADLKAFHETIDSFQIRYGLQQSSFISHDRLYFCLEERYLSRDKLQQFIIPSNDDSSPSRHINALKLMELIEVKILVRLVCC